MKTTAGTTYEKRKGMARSVAVLPEDEQQKLREDRENSLEALYQRVYALRQAQWPLRAIGEAVDAPRSTVRMWELKADPKADAPTVPECPRAEQQRGERTVRLRLDVPAAEREELRTLAEQARTVRGRTPKDHPARKAADKLDKMIETYISRNVPVKRIANHMGVTPRAVAARYERYLERKGKIVA